MSEAAPQGWVDAALEGLAPGDPNYATVKKAVIELASRFTTAGIEPNRQFIETMRDVKTVRDLGAVIAGLAVLLDHKGTEGMSKEEASEALDAHVTGLAANPAAGEAGDNSSATAPSADAENEAQSQRGIAASRADQLINELTQVTERESPWTDELSSSIPQRIADSVEILKDPYVEDDTKNKIRELVEKLNERVAARADAFLARYTSSTPYSTLYKAAKYDYDNAYGNGVSVSTDQETEYTNAKANNPEIYGAIQRALWDRQNAYPFNKPEPSTRPVVTTGAGDGGYALRPPSVLKF